MDPPTTEKPALPTWKEHWGEYAKAPPVSLEPRVMVLVPEEFIQGTIANLFKAAGRPPPEKGLTAFATECLLQWHEEYRNKKGLAGADRRAEILRWVPTPARGELSAPIAADLQGKVADTAFGRSVGGRFPATAAGTKMALREALLMGLERVRAEAEDRAHKD